MEEKKEKNNIKNNDYISEKWEKLAIMIHFIIVMMYPSAGSSLLMLLFNRGIISVEGSRKIISYLVAGGLTLGYYVVVAFITKKLRRFLHAGYIYKQYIHIAMIFTLIPAVFFGLLASDSTWMTDMWLCCLPMCVSVLNYIYDPVILFLNILLFYFPVIYFLGNE